MKYRGFDCTEEFVNDLKKTLDIDIKDLIDNYLDKRVSNLNKSIGNKVYNINIEDNKIRVMLRLIRI